MGAMRRIFRRRPEAATITDAPESPESEFRRRRLRYLLMMVLRLVCLILAAVVIGADVPYAGWWAAACIAGMVVLPWAAVLIANDRLPDRKPRRAQKPSNRRPQLPSAATKALPAQKRHEP